MFPHSVSRAPIHLYVQPSLRAVRPQFILVCSDLLFRVPTLSFPFALSRAQTHLPGFLPSSRRHQSAATIREAFQLFATFRPQVFSTSRRFLPRSGFASLFHPAATSRVQPVQGLLPLHSHPSSSEGACPLAVSKPPLTHRNELPRSAASTSRLFSVPRCVPRLRGLAAIPVAPFLRFPLLQVLRLLAVALVLPEGLRSCRFEVRLRSRAGQLRSASASCQRGARLVCFQTADLLELFEPSAFSCPNRRGSCAS